MRERGKWMFKTETDRLNYGNILTPPEGYQLEKAIGTTYSLDLEALTAIAITLGLAEDTDSQLAKNPISMLHALQKVSDKIIIFCEAGQIKIPGAPSSLCLILEKMVIPVALPKDRKQGSYPAFHPKTWVLQYSNSQGEFIYRYVVLSRNLTFDRSWDISIVLESSKKIRQVRKTKPIIHFLEYLQTQIKSTVQDANKKKSIIASLMQELEKVSFATGWKEFDDGDFDILPLGIGDNAYRMEEDPLFQDTYNELVIMSPFLTDKVIEQLGEDKKGLKDCQRTLITRKSELSKLKEPQVKNYKIYTLKDEIVDGEQALSDESDEKKKQDIHAKIYLRRKYSDTDLYLGSMNASTSAIQRNVEMMVRFSAKNRYLNGTKFLEDIFGGAPDNNKNPFEESQVMQPKENQAEVEKNKLERLIKDVCRMKSKAVIAANDDKFDIKITFQTEMRSENLIISPLRSNKAACFSNVMHFENLDMLQLSQFYCIKAVGENMTVERVIMIPTQGLPEGRESAVVNSVIKDKKSFMDYIAFVLGDDYMLTLLEKKQIGTSGFSRDETEALPAIYEKMLKTALDEPERIREINYILSKITDEEIVTEDFRNLYLTFKSTLKLK
jgi:hypothetical protein